MAEKSGVSEQVISLPKGGGELKGLGEKFQPDLHTGSGYFTVPIFCPNGRNSFQPQLSLKYSAGYPNGVYGLGWTLTVPKISRKTSKGIPKYSDIDSKAEQPSEQEKTEDVFVLSESDDLVNIGNNYYKPKTEGAFARIQRIRNPEDNSTYWIIREKNGLVSTYGKTQDSRVTNGKSAIFEWLISETEDPCGNRIVYRYKRDEL
jgi:Salmonella virulence plasmid 65kDa B protein